MEDRLLAILKHFELTPAVFADMLNVQRSSISHLLSGRNKPSFDFLLKLTGKFPEINIDWFISGKGNMLRKKPDVPVNLTLFDSLADHSVSGNSPEQSSKTLSGKDTAEDITNVTSASGTKSKISRIVLFYEDKTWEEFLPGED